MIMVIISKMLFWKCDFSKNVSDISYVNIMKQKWAMFPEIYHLYKSLSLFYEKNVTYYCILFFYKQTFFLNLTLFWSNNFRHNFFTFLSFDIFFHLGVHPVLLNFFIWTSQTLIKWSIFFKTFTATKCSYYVRISHEIFVPANHKN